MIARIRGTRSVERLAVVGEHFYQPPRKGTHTRVRGIKTDPNDTDWNKVISQECYIPQVQRGTLEHASFDFYTTIRREMTSFSTKEASQLKEVMKERGVGDPFLHVLLPDLNRRDKEILITAGYLAFTAETNVAPQWFWPPETALDTETLEVLARVGYTGVLCAPEQIEGVSYADNTPVVLKLPNKSQILALPFDRPFSSSLAFADKSNADEYARTTIAPRIHRLPESMPLVGWTDGETFGHHAKFADLFLDYLLKESLPNLGVAVLGLNQITEVWEKRDYKEGKLRERTAWSCPHGNLVRWNGACPCDGGHNGEWKKHFSSVLRTLNAEVDKLLDSELGKHWPEELAKNFAQYFYYKGANNSRRSLLAAKASALASMTSCGTFFESPSTSGNINLLFAQQTLENLKDAGFIQVAQRIQRKLISELSKGVDPFSNKNLVQTFSKFLD